MYACIAQCVCDASSTVGQGAIMILVGGVCRVCLAGSYVNFRIRWSVQGRQAEGALTIASKSSCQSQPGTGAHLLWKNTIQNVYSDVHAYILFLYVYSYDSMFPKACAQ